jgi:hypothetical protein
MILKLSDELRQKIISRLSMESSDTVLAKEFGVHRKTIWRLRQIPHVKSDEIIPPPSKELAPIEIPPVSPVPEIPERSIPAPRPEKPSKLNQETSKETDILSPTELHTYFAVQILKRENYKDVVQTVLSAADANKILFRKIQVLDVNPVGATNFVKFRSDVADASGIVKNLEGRAFIIKIDGSFIVHFPNGRIGGKYPIFGMCSTPKIGFGHTFAGTRVKRWRYQFQDQAN